MPTKAPSIRCTKLAKDHAGWFQHSQGDIHDPHIACWHRRCGGHRALHHNARSSPVRHGRGGQAVLESAVTAVKADKPKALADCNSPSGTFRDRDLHVFCSGADGILTAHPSIKGQQITSLVDKNGKKLGEAIVAAAKEG